jgi:hypothetical protein
MNIFMFATIAGGSLTTLAMGFAAGAEAAPSGIGSAQDTVNELESYGYKVILNKLGPGPLDHCSVDSVRPGAAVVQPVGAGSEVLNQIVYQTVYLTAKC